MLLFTDSSALVKYYVNEDGSTWLRQQVDQPENIVIVAAITLVEVSSALARLRRDGVFGNRFLQKTFLSFREDMRSAFRAHPVDEETLELAAQLALRHPLKGYDAVQLASCVIMQQHMKEMQILFISSDGQLLRAAQAERLVVDNPEKHLMDDQTGDNA